MTAATEFTIRRQFLSLAGAKFHLFNAANEPLGFCKQKAFKLKEDIRIYTDETMREERLSIQARSVVDFSAAYDILDSRNQTKVGALRRKGLRSLFRDEWTVLDGEDNEIGTITEDSTALALVRRFISNLIPQKFHLRDGSGRELVEFRSHFNPFIHRMTVSVYPEFPLDPLLVLAAGMLLMAIEGRQG